VVLSRGLGELTRCKMYMALPLSCSQEEVHYILKLSTKEKVNEIRTYMQVTRTFFRRAFVSGWSKAPAMFKRVTFRSDLFSKVSFNVFFSPFTTS
jgi:hypothetical protein